MNREEMVPALQAVADRLLMDVACLKHLAAVLPALSLERKTDGSGWTVRQSLNHAAVSLEFYAAALDRFRDGQPPVPEGWDPDHQNALEAATTGARTIPEILERISTARDALLHSLERLEPAHLAWPFEGEDSFVFPGEWSAHLATHGLDLVLALPELTVDPILATWLLDSELGEYEPTVLARERFAARVAALPPIPEEET